VREGHDDPDRQRRARPAHGKAGDTDSGGSRPPAGEHAFATLRGALSTAREHGRTAIACLRDACTPPRLPALARSG
jgi:hypothetical protein